MGRGRQAADRAWEQFAPKTARRSSARTEGTVPGQGAHPRRGAADGGELRPAAGAAWEGPIAAEPPGGERPYGWCAGDRPPSWGAVFISVAYKSQIGICMSPLVVP